MKTLVKNKLSTLSVVLSATLLTACGSGANTTSGTSSSVTSTQAQVAVSTSNSSPIIMGYYTNWSTYKSGANYQPTDIPKEVNEVLYAFMQVGGCNTTEEAIATEAEYANGTAKCMPQYNDKKVMLQPGTQDYKLWTTDGYSDFYSYEVGDKDIGGLGNIAKTLKTGKSVLLSIGGWTLSAPIREAIKPEHQAQFIQSIIDFMHKAEQDAASHGVKNKFAGVDIDWEPNGNLWTLPSNNPSQFVSLSKNDLDNYAAFLVNLKAALVKNGSPTLKIAMTASPAAIKDVNKVSPNYWSNLSSNGVYLDIMSYDYNAQEFTPSCPFTEFNSPLWSDPANPCAETKDFSINNSVLTLNETGVPMSSIGIGIPAYGRSYTLNSISDVSASNMYAQYINGSYIQNPAVKDFHSTWTYREIITGRAFGADTASENTNWTKVASYAVGQTAATAYVDYKVPAWISYTSKSDAAKVMDYAKTKGLSGVMIWELDQDVQQGDSLASGEAIDLNEYSLVAGLAGSATYKTEHKLEVVALNTGLQVFGISNGTDSIGQLDYMGAGTSKVYGASTNPSVEAIDGANALVVSWGQWGALPELTTCPKFNFTKDIKLTINGSTKECAVE